jgi:N-acetylglucosamine-6-phosphate deacetylase
LNKGELTAGYDADVTVLSDDLTVKAVFVGGEQVV